MTSKPHLHEDVKFTKKGKIEGLEERWSEFQKLLVDFRKTYKPNLVYWVTKEYQDRHGTKKKGEEPHSAAVILSHVPNEPKSLIGKAFRDCVDDGVSLAGVDHPDCLGRTALVTSVLKGRKDQAKILVEDGKANVNFYYTKENPVGLAIRTTKV